MSCALGSEMGWRGGHSAGGGTEKWVWGRIGWGRMVDGAGKVVGLISRGQMWAAVSSQLGGAAEGPSQHK